METNLIEKAVKPAHIQLEEAHVVIDGVTLDHTAGPGVLTVTTRVYLQDGLNYSLHVRFYLISDKISIWVPKGDHELQIDHLQRALDRVSVLRDSIREVALGRLKRVMA